MSVSKKVLRQYLSQLVLSIPVEKYEQPSDAPETFGEINELIVKLLNGEASTFLIHFEQVLFTEKSRAILREFPEKQLSVVLNSYVEEVASSFVAKFAESKIYLQILAISILQTFIQSNFTGPAASFTCNERFFPTVDPNVFQFESVKLLNVDGNQAYDLMSEPFLLSFASILFEKLVGISSKFSFINKNKDVAVEQYSDLHTSIVSNLNDDPISASLFWWRSRLLQVHISVLSDPPSVLSTASSILFDVAIANVLAPASDNNVEIQKNIQLLYYLEAARFGIHSQTEHLSIPLLGRARKLSDLQFVLSGAKAKRTKFQKFLTASLIVLAKSKGLSILDSERNSSDDGPESHELDSDLLLEKPHFESLDDILFDDEQSNAKRIKYDDFVLGVDTAGDEQEEKLLPVAIRQDLIPEDLKELDPNNQPALNNIDNLQLLLRLTTIKQTTPSSDALVEEELLALVGRILYTNPETTVINWTIFSRALWERSILETSKSRTIERGILQMTSLVEEVGIKVKSRMIPQAEEIDFSPVSTRLRFIHQLPLLPQWKMDAKLAEKYMSLGVLRSAIDIYERLEMACEAALCHAAVGEELQALRILEQRILTHPEDVRAMSILGDINQDPTLWQKAWEIGRYSKAKAALAHYYYSPPKDSGLEKNIDLTISNMHECLTSNPLNHDNWFFYGCCGLESGQYDLAAEAFTRCVSLDDSLAHGWSNLGSALLKIDKTRPAFNAIKKAIRTSGDGKKSWRIYENYTVVAMRLHEWSDALIGVRKMIELRKETEGELAIDIPIIEKLVEILVSTEYIEDKRLEYYQSSCIDLVCSFLPTVITSNARCWRIVARVELWRNKPWAALDSYEKAYRATSQKADLTSDEATWNEAVEACGDLVSAYENLGELPGKHSAGDLVCKDWKYKARSTVRSLMSSGKIMWEDSEGWEKLQEIKSDLTN